MKILYSNILGSGPYHEEERLWMEKHGDTYVITHKIIAPMAGGGEWSYYFNKNISQSEFLNGLYSSLPYVANIFPKFEAKEVLNEIQIKPQTENDYDNQRKPLELQITSLLKKVYEKKSNEEFQNNSNAKTEPDEKLLTENNDREVQCHSAITNPSDDALYELFSDSEYIPVSRYYYRFYIDKRNGTPYMLRTETLMYEDVYDEVDRSFAKITYNQLLSFCRKFKNGKAFCGINANNWKDYVFSTKKT